MCSKIATHIEGNRISREIAYQANVGCPLPLMKDGARVKKLTKPDIAKNALRICDFDVTVIAQSSTCSTDLRADRARHTADEPEVQRVALV